MASIFKRNKTWYVSWVKAGKQTVKSLDTSDAKVARHKKEEIEAKLRKGEIQSEKRILVEDYFKQYEAETTYRKKSTNVADYSRVRGFLRTHGKKTINSISYDDVQDYLKRFETKSPKTYNSAVITLRRFFRLAVQRGYLLGNPVEGFRHKKVPQALPHFFKDAEYELLEKLARDEGIYPMVVTARYTGLRLSELLHLEWQDFDWGRSVVTVTNKPHFDFTVKNYLARVVPIGQDLREKLQGYIKSEGLCFPAPDGTPYNCEGPRKLIRRVIDKSKLRKGKRMGWHEFRHTFASRLMQNNASVGKVSKWLGHSDLKTTQIYVHYSPIYDSEIEKLNIDKPTSPSA